MTCADKTRFLSLRRLAGAATEETSATGSCCRDNTCGVPGCEIRACSQSKKLNQCMDCDDYPCRKFQTAQKEISVPQTADHG